MLRLLGRFTPRIVSGKTEVHGSLDGADMLYVGQETGLSLTRLLEDGGGLVEVGIAEERVAGQYPSKSCQRSYRNSLLGHAHGCVSCRENYV